MTVDEGGSCAMVQEFILLQQRKQISVLSWEDPGAVPRRQGSMGSGKDTESPCRGNP